MAPRGSSESFDLTGTDVGGGQGEPPKPGVYRAKVVKMDDRRKATPAKQDVHVVIELIDKPNAGYRIHDYIALPFAKDNPSAWKQAQFLNATTGSLKGKLNFERPADLNIIKVSTKNETWSEADGGDGRTNAKVKSYILISDDEGDDDGDEDVPTLAELEEMDVSELEDLLEESDIELPDDLPKPKAKRKAALIDYIVEELGVNEEAGEEEDEPEEDGEEDEVDLEEMSTKELEEFAEEEEIDISSVKAKGTKRKAALVEFIAEAMDAEPENDDEEEDEGDDEEPDLESMTLAELKEFAEEEGLTVPTVRGKGAKEKLLAAIQEAIGSDDEDEPEEEGDDYDEWELSDLKEELAEREVKDKLPRNPKAAKTKAIELLRASDAEDVLAK